MRPSRAFLILPFVLLCGCRQTPLAPPAAGNVDLSGLQDSLERTAEKNLPIPSMLDSVTVELAADQLENRAREIQTAAQELGGTALANRENGGFRILVRVPGNQGTALRTRLGLQPSATAPATDGLEMIEIVLRPALSK